MIINGKQMDYPHGVRLAAVLKKENFRMERIAVELNGEIVSKSKYEEVILKEEDHLEVVSFVGGG
ncbi:MAG: sulfur carrier protein ThiS [Lachnospiraceae bacterium]